MAERIVETKESLQRTLESLRTLSGGKITHVDSTDYSIRIQKAQNILLQNEKKIWLKTKDGKEMLERLSDSSIRLLESVLEIEKSSGADSGKLNNLTTALKEVEVQALRLDEESRRRGMVVT